MGSAIIADRVSPARRWLWLSLLLAAACTLRPPLPATPIPPPPGPTITAALPPATSTPSPAPSTPPETALAATTTPGALGSPLPFPSDPADDLWATQLPQLATRLSPAAVLSFTNYFSPTTGSKLGLHFVFNTQASFQFLRDTSPPVVKLTDDFSWLADLRRDLPATIIIARLNDEDSSLTRIDPISAATRYVRERLPVYQAHPQVDYWEGWNEWHPQTPEQWDWYASFEGQRACLMRHYGLKAVIGNFSTGTPEFGEMLLFLPAIRIGLECGAILGLHEYSAPTLDFGYGLAIPRRPAFPDRGILTLRYRYFYEDIFMPLNLPIPLVLTEMGVDGGVGAGRPGPPSTGGWMDFQDYWYQQGLGDNGPLVYANQLAWYDSELRKDPYVIGATIFTAGRVSSWDSFNVERVLPYLTDYVRSVEGD